MKNQLITEREYEVYFSEIHILPSDDFGTTRLNFYVRIRKDVNQKFKNRVVFKILYLDKSIEMHHELRRILIGLGCDTNFDFDNDIPKFIKTVVNKPFKIRIIKQLKYHQPKFENTICFDEIDRTEYPNFKLNK